jgi:uncharacterized membrane protein
MPKKFDTNQLDPEFPKSIAESQQTQTLPNLNGNTQTFAPTSVTEEQTKRFENQQFANMFEQPNYQPPSLYQTARLANLDQKPINRKVDKVGLPENVLVALPYLPWGLGMVSGLIELLIVPNSEPKVRFHAAQGLALHVGLLIVTAILGVVGNISNWASFGGKIFTLAMTICSFYWAYKAYQGDPVHIESVDDLTNWLEEKVKLKN